MTSPDTLVDVIVAQFGGAHRARLHALGIGVAGRFVPDPAARTLSRAAIFSGPPIPVTTRFSNSSGHPTADDRTPDVRGIAVKFHISGGVEADMIGITLPMFFVRTAEDFADFSRLNVPDPSTGVVDTDAFVAWLSSHPEALTPFGIYRSLAPDASYARCQYHDIHAFRLVSDASSTWVRFAWEPEEGVATLTPEQAAGMTPDYLRRDIAQRMRGGQPAVFTLVAQIGEDGDDTADPTTPWPSTRRQVVLGRLELSALVADQYWDCEALAFNPTRIVDGIELSGDPVLLARGAAYPVSTSRRTAAYPPPRPD